MLMRAIIAASALCLTLLSSSAFGQQVASKFGEMGQIPCDDVKGWLDSSAVELERNPNAKLYIVFYGGKSYFNNLYDRRTGDYSIGRTLLPRHGEAKARISWWKSYLIIARGVEASRIEVIDGGYRNEFTVELWLVPSGANPPTLKPTLTEKDIRFRSGRPNCNEMFGSNSECGCEGYR
jgi:hypothetical protein